MISCKMVLIAPGLLKDDEEEVYRMSEDASQLPQSC